MDCVPSPVSREHWGQIRDENGRVPDFVVQNGVFDENGRVPDSVVQNGVFDEARNRHVEK